MTITASDVGSLSRSLSRWEVGEYFCAALVTVACAGEYVAEFTNWFTAGVKARKDALAKRSTLLLVASLALELICLVKTNSVSGTLIGSLSDKADNADRKAQSAVDKSSLADSKAGAAASTASTAETAAGKAQEKVGGVAKRAEQIDAGLAQTQYLISARYFPNPNGLTEQLRQFKGQAVSIRSYVGDGEGWGLCTALWYVAHAAEMNATNDCGMSPATIQPFFGISITGPDDKAMESLSKAIGQSGVFGGASSGPYGNAPHSPTLVIFVGSKPPFNIGQARGVKVPTNKQTKKQSAKP